MTSPDVDQELERLFSVARAATAPDVEARERVRSSLAPRLGPGGSAPPSNWGPRSWLGVGMAVLGAGAIALWLAVAPPGPSVSAPVTSVPALARSTLVASPPLSESTPNPAPLASLEAPRALPPLQADVPKASSSRAPASDELSLVRAMQQALRAGDSRRALVLAADHARSFPRGNLSEEREGVRAVARCQLATPEVRPQVLSSFIQRFAKSPYVARVKAACE